MIRTIKGFDGTLIYAVDAPDGEHFFTKIELAIKFVCSFGKGK